MIGGTDIYIETPKGTPALELAIGVIRQFWPKAVVEDAASAELLQDKKNGILSRLREVLVYRNALAFKKWEELGADPTLDGTMIHLLAAKGELTVVVDDKPDGKIRAIVECIQDAITPPEVKPRSIHRKTRVQTPRTKTK